jgi:PAS domain S-box-containing protein
MVLDAVPAAIWIAHDSQALQITGNRLSYEWLRIPYGANASKSAPEGERPETFRMFKDGIEILPAEMPVQVSAAGTEVMGYEFDFVYQDGSLRHVLGNASPLRDKHGNPRGSVSAFVDITERKLAYEALTESEQRYSTTLASIGDAVITTDIEGKINFMNGVAEELTGWKFAEASKMPTKAVFDIVNEHTRLEVENPIAKVLEKGAIIGLANHTILIRRDGTEVAIDDSGAPIKDYDGNTTGVVLVFRDITERKRVEEELERLASFPQLNPNPIIEVGPDGHVYFLNPAAQKLFPDLQERECDHPLLADLGSIMQAFCENKASTYVRDVPFGDNWYQQSIYFFPNAQSIRVYSLDITERKHAEKALSRAKDELEHKVKERTLELQSTKEELEAINEELRVGLKQHQKLEAELVKARDAAEAAADAKAAFLANMSHELRTPMNSVISFTSLLLDDNLNTEQKEYIDGIRNGGEVMMALINDILDFSRADKEKVELEQQPFSLKRLIEEALDIVAVEAEHKGLNLAQTISYRTPDTIVGDHGRLRQILVNLLNNAVKFTDEGDISLSVSSKTLEGNKRQIHFSVKDTGIGIPQDKMSQIFEPFTRLERTISCQRDGAGLGLAISKRLVELMGGEIWAESVPGKGTTFHFTIPAETIPGRNLSGEKSKTSSVQILSELKPLRILVADDNPSNQRVLVEMLKRLGNRADAVADGKEVLQALERQHYDLVLMDVRMPEMDGITATQVIRRLQPRGDPKIVAITAYALEGDKERCLEAGMDDYISKPVKIEDLEAILIKYSE